MVLINCNVLKSFALCCLSISAHAGTMGPITSVTPWSVIASLGYGSYDNMIGKDGQTAIGRLALHKAFTQFSMAQVGAELGVQNGNHMRLAMPQATIDAMGGLPFTTTMKPMLDLLLTLKSAPIANTPVFAELKGGIAYRMWQVERDTVNSQTKIDGEVQAGLGMAISSNANLSLLYQGVFGKTPRFSNFDPVELTGTFSGIPIQHAGLLSLTYQIN